MTEITNFKKANQDLSDFLKEHFPSINFPNDFYDKDFTRMPCLTMK